MPKLLDWIKGGTPLDLNAAIAEGEATLAKLESERGEVVLLAADGDPQAQGRYRILKSELASVVADLEMLKAARVEASSRKEKDQLAQRRQVHRDRVAEIKADLARSVEHAADLEQHLAKAVEAYDALVLARGDAMGHALVLPNSAEVHKSVVRNAVAQELYRQGARLNSVSVSQWGFPGGAVEDGRFASRPDLITPLAERLRAADVWTVTVLEESAP